MNGPDATNFQVDLRGVVDLLARHLYSGPRVYLRELLQNGVDAITARRAVDPAAPARVRLRPFDGGGLEVTDTGVGLTPDEARELLATIGRSSKRDLDLGVGRDEFLGQFGIGLLSAFMVAERIELVSRSAVHPDAPVVRWCGYDDGSYTLEELTGADAARQDVGSTVRLLPRRDAEHWLEPTTVVALAEEFGGLLPVDVAVQVPLVAVGGPDDGAPEGAERVWRRTSAPALPWRTGRTGEQRDAELADYCERTFGFRPLAHLDLDVPVAGVDGVAFILPSSAPASAAVHRVYLKRMLLGTRVPTVLPDWAFFARCVLDASALRPTASREALYEDEVLLATRDALGAAVRTWTIETLRSSSGLRRRFVEAHHLALRALATSDDDVLDLTAQVLPYETTDGTHTLEEVRQATGSIVYAATVEEYRRIAPVARAEGLVVVNGGYAYDSDILERLAARHPSWGVRPLSTSDVAQVLGLLPPVREIELAGFVTAANALLEPLECELQLREFEPTSLPALLLQDREGDHQRNLARTVAEGDDLWGELLTGFARDAQPRRLVLNCANPVVADLVDAPAGDVRDAGVRSLYVSATLLAGEPLRARDAELMTSALAVLLRAGVAQASVADGAVPPAGDPHAPGTDASGVPDPDETGGPR
ncbi:HSP90 family protein [Cellulomonas gilvus]|uniref:ATP-binding region ATPase domain protein n=1 Tax=Cellulomonas gilvus (strain ATCC 13127 / NRRL B-14078) TaxID=593907 RepID=F7ZZP1_CELGA|nr:HSP90 family protein [Cellulomonas gilvus]AEI12534.1 ATP-binding region ATPase domain protein [Cellulomonas gilvus ATCC 13127]